MASSTPEPQPDPEPYLRLLAQHERWLAAYVHSLVPRSHDADDILQEVKVTLWKQFSKFEQGTNFRAWARTVATHQVLNHRRAARRHQGVSVEEDFIEAVAAEIDRQSDGLDRKADALRLCVQRLPDAHRKMVQLRYFEECSIADIAERTQRTAEAVYRLLSRIRAVLNECVSRQAS
jgi:RNA polymerase sigma-70 factor (ECF subfamily)